MLKNSTESVQKKSTDLKKYRVEEEVQRAEKVYRAKINVIEQKNIQE